MQECRPVSTPMTKTIVTHEQEKHTYPFPELVGSLIYLSTTTRPDISYAVGILSRFLTSYTKAHWISAKRVLRYLSGTPNYGILFSPDETSKIIAYSDADFAGDSETRKSTSGYCIFYGGLVSWKSQRQTLVTLSTMESEYVALTSTAQEILWLKKLLVNLFPNQKFECEVKEDNKATLALLKDPVFHQRSKHIDIKFQFIKEAIRRKEIYATYCPTSEMVADAFTKPLDTRKFSYFRDNMMSSG
jgi:hypothetical protein